jgi:ornithine lipid ester-linked acyl 2-hydroxylase
MTTQVYVKSWQESLRKFLLKQGGIFLVNLERYIAEASLIGNEPFFDTRQFEWISTLESSWITIRQELDRILQQSDNLPNFQDISKDQYSITQDNLWKAYMLYAFGIKSDKNCIRCPQTTRLIESIPGMKTAFFSILLPGKHIPQHRGPYKGLVRYHLALKVPTHSSGCGICVKSETRHWQEGKSLVFDDTFPHSAWNDTNDIRVVLFLDFMRPLRRPAALINKMIVQCIAWSPYIQDNVENFQKWDERLAEVYGDRMD